MPMVVLPVLSRIYSVLGILPATRRLVPSGILTRAARLWLGRAVVQNEIGRPDDVTVLIGVRDRADYRLRNALVSVRAQVYSPHRVRACVVDYGSDTECARRIEVLCQDHDAEYVRVDDAKRWNRSHCLNIGIRRTETKFVMTSDVDVLISPRYVADAVRLLRSMPLSVVCSAMRDLPEECAEVLERCAELGEPLPFEQLVPKSTPRHGWRMHPSLGISYTAYYKLIRGYDEFYELYGVEDQDLARRFNYVGIDLVPLDTDSYYLHQWHPRFEGVSTDADLKRALLRNRDYGIRTHGILRNSDGWGTPSGARS